MFFDKSVLEEALRMVKAKSLLSEMDGATFGSRTEIVSFNNSLLTLSVPSQFYFDRFNGNVKTYIQEALSEIEGQSILLNFTIKEKMPEIVREPVKRPYSASPIKPEPQVKARPSDLQPIYTFNTFVPGESNHFALGISRWIAENPSGNKYNPCLISGGVGLGKTHLLKAIGNYIYDQNPSFNIKYITGKKMFQEVTDSTAINDLVNYWKQYDNLDLLLIDDIHELESKNSTQEHLYSKLDILHNNKKPVIFTCDRPITELKKITTRLLDRFARGTLADLQQPDFETKIAIINKKLELKGRTFSPDVVELIASNINQSVRELESAIDSLVAYTEMTGKPITIDLARSRLHFQNQNNSSQGSVISMSLVQKVVADYFNISNADLKSKKKSKSIVYPRHLAIYIIRQITDYSTTEIGIEFGNRDHTTIMHAYNKIEELIKSDPKQNTTINNLIRAIREGH